ncbi:Uncharacterised protein [Vibrio cholerae]|nr:Uncharacterised protein [Vibrio cholerae]
MYGFITKLLALLFRELRNDWAVVEREHDDWDRKPYDSRHC